MSAKHTPYWHPAFPMADGRRYCAIERRDAARLIRQHRAEKTTYATHAGNGQTVYVLTVGAHESGRIYMVAGSAA